MPAIDVILDLTAEQCAAHYAGQTKQVYASSVDGRRVLLPAEVLRRVVARDGVHGVYRLNYKPDGKVESIVLVKALSGTRNIP